MVVLFGFLFVTVSSRITGVIGSSSNPISGMTIATLLLVCLIFVVLGWVGPEFRLTALSIAGRRLHRVVQRRNHVARLEDRLPGRRHAVEAAGCDPGRRTDLGPGHGSDPSRSERRIYHPPYRRRACCRRVKASADELKGSEIGKDGKSYRVWWVLNPRPGVQAGKYLVDESLEAREFVDPGIGGRMTTDENGAKIQKFNPAQPQLFATLIQGIMARDLPWGLVIIGAVLAIVMQLCGVSALAFAVGVYLPLSTTLPIFVGGMVRKLVDRARKFSDEEADMSPGTLMSTGLIAGGSLAGIIVAFLIFLPGL